MHATKEKPGTDFPLHEELLQSEVICMQLSVHSGPKPRYSASGCMADEKVTVPVGVDKPSLNGQERCCPT